jgi:hypothetical protein
MATFSANPLNKKEADMYAQAILPHDFNPYAPAGGGHATRASRAPRKPTLRPETRRKVVAALEVTSWLAAPVALAVYLFAT